MLIKTELRQYVYKCALIAPSIQPDETTLRTRPRILEAMGYVPTPALLRVSKQFYTEASPILYACNTFTTRHLPLAKLYDPRQEEKQVWFWINHSGECHPVMVDAVSTIFEENQDKISPWLAIRRDGSDHVYDFKELHRWIHRSAAEEERDGFRGLLFTGFLRAIGCLNTLRITTIELLIGPVPEAADILVVYAEVLKQYMTGLKRVVVCKSSARLRSCYI